MAGFRRWSLRSPQPIMSEAIAIHETEIIDLVASHPEGLRLGGLIEMVEDRHGRHVSFHTGSAHGMTLDGLLAHLETRGKVRITSGVVYPGC